MKTVKFLFASLVFLLVCGTAEAQSTPEAIIGQCPALPSPRDLATGNTEAFKAGIERLQQRNEQSVKMPDPQALQSDAAKMQSEAEAKAKEMTGYSVAELQNMSDAERKALANRLANRQLAEAQKPSKQSKAEIESDAVKMRKLLAAKDAQNKVYERIQQIESMLRKEHESIGVQIAEICRKHEPAIQKAKKDTDECSGETRRSDAWCEAAWQRLKDAYIARDTEAFTVWRAQIGREQGLYKELLPEAQHADALLKESNAAQHPDVLNRQRGKAASDIAMKTSIEGVMPAMVAGRYLTISKSVTEY
ncbi:hypothetical protein FACS1894181_06260 [Bacteroidia bacterium]|nr:hypothetical protein FACS1894181_06260 [Bacteroidia bacterium]